MLIFDASLLVPNQSNSKKTSFKHRTMLRLNMELMDIFGATLKSLPTVSQKRGKDHRKPISGFFSINQERSKRLLFSSNTVTG